MHTLCKEYHACKVCRVHQILIRDFKYVAVERIADVEGNDRHVVSHKHDQVVTEHVLEDETGSDE